MNSNVDYPYGYQSSIEACSLGGVSGYADTYYYTGTLGNGTILYLNSNLTQPFDQDGSFGWYWINGYSFTYSGGIANYTACPSFPSNVTLTFTSYSAGDAEFTLSGILRQDLEITSWSVNGYTTGACTGGVVESDSYASTTLFWSRGNSGSKFGYGSSQMSCSTIRYRRVNSIFVAVAGGSSSNYTNGSTFTVAGVQTVTVAINTGCTNYAC